MNGFNILSEKSQEQGHRIVLADCILGVAITECGGIYYKAIYYEDILEWDFIRCESYHQAYVWYYAYIYSRI